MTLCLLDALLGHQVRGFFENSCIEFRALYKRSLAPFDSDTVQRAWQKIVAEHTFWGTWLNPGMIAEACRQCQPRPIPPPTDGQRKAKPFDLADDYATGYMKTSHLAKLAEGEGWSGRLLECVTDAGWVQAQLLCDVRDIGWNARAALVTQIARSLAHGREDRFLDARLAFERLFVSAVARQEHRDESWRKASRRLPGINRARQALRSGDQPLQRENFLKGQAVNGPYGVIARLAKNIGVVDEAGELGRAGTELLLAWAQDQGLQGLLDDEGQSEGGKWLKKVVRQVADYLDDPQNWPRRHWLGWDDLAKPLRLDDLGTRERKIIHQLLSQDPLGLRDRVLGRLAEPDVLGLFRQPLQDSYGGTEQAVIARGLRQHPAQTGDEVDRALYVTTELIDAYESVSGLLETVFRGLLWGLTRSQGQAPRAAVVSEPVLRPVIEKAQAATGPEAFRFQQALQAFEADPVVAKRGSVDIDRMHRLVDNAVAASHGPDTCVSSIMERQRKVQKEKRKTVWIEEDRMWMLMPGFGDIAEEPTWYNCYLHPFRITNAYSMLADLQLVPAKDEENAEEDQ
jgi:hypothetical protein